jgi:hypothetical protein
MRLSVTCLVCFLAPTAASGQSRLDGTWQGYWSRAGDTLPVTLVVQRDTTTGRHTAAFSSERLRVGGIPFGEVRIEGCCDVTLVLRGDQTTIEFTGLLHGDSLTGVLREGSREGRFAYHRRLPEAPPYDERDIAFQNGAVTLAGTLLLPRAEGRVPVVVFLHGSGPEGRWGSRYLATQVAAHGIAGLIFDKRGVGASSGDWRLATPDDLVSDAAAADSARGRAADRPDAYRDPRTQSGARCAHGRGALLFGGLRRRISCRGAPMDSVEIFSVLNSVLPAATTLEDTASAVQYVSELVGVAYRGRRAWQWIRSPSC